MNATIKRRFAVCLVSHKDYRDGVLEGIGLFQKTRPDFEFVAVDDPAELKGTVCDGVLANIQDETVELFRELKKPVVKIGARRDYAQFSSVQMDNQSAGRLGACHLMCHGYRNFGFLSVIDQPYAQERQEGFEAQLAAFGLPNITLELHEAEEFALASGPLVRLWLSGIKAPSAVMGCTDLMGRRLIELCRQVKIRVPEDTAVLGFNNGLIECEGSLPYMSSIPQERRRLGYRSAELLSRQLDGEFSGIQRIYIRARYIVTRTSTMPFVFEDAQLNHLLERLQGVVLEGNRLLADAILNDPVGDMIAAYFKEKAHGNDLRQDHLRAQILLSERLVRQTRLPFEELARLCGVASEERFNGLFKLAFDHDLQTYRDFFANDPFAQATGVY